MIVRNDHPLGNGKGPVGVNPAGPKPLQPEACKAYLAGDQQIALDSIPFLNNAQDIDILLAYEKEHQNRGAVVGALEGRLQAGNVGGTTCAKESEEPEIIEVRQGYDPASGRLTLTTV